MKPLTVEERLAIGDLYAEYAAAIDEARYDDWLDLFVEDCTYRIVPRENWDAKLPLSLVLCESKDMLRDRIVALREANEYPFHVDRHLISGVRVRGHRADTTHVVQVHADYAVYHSDSEGEASLFAVGTYIDEVLLTAHGARFRSKIVIMDNSCVPHAVTTPL